MDRHHANESSDNGDVEDTRVTGSYTEHLGHECSHTEEERIVQLEHWRCFTNIAYSLANLPSFPWRLIEPNFLTSSLENMTSDSESQLKLDDISNSSVLKRRIFGLIKTPYSTYWKLPSPEGLVTITAQGGKAIGGNSGKVAAAYSSIKRLLLIEADFHKWAIDNSASDQHEMEFQKLFNENTGDSKESDDKVDTLLVENKGEEDQDDNKQLVVSENAGGTAAIESNVQEEFGDSDSFLSLMLINDLNPVDTEDDEDDSTESANRHALFHDLAALYGDGNGTGPVYVTLASLGFLEPTPETDDESEDSYPYDFQDVSPFVYDDDDEDSEVWHVSPYIWDEERDAHLRPRYVHDDVEQLPYYYEDDSSDSPYIYDEESDGDLVPRYVHDDVEELPYYYEDNSDSPYYYEEDSTDSYS